MARKKHFDVHSHLHTGAALKRLQERAQEAEERLQSFVDAWEACCGWPDTSGDRERLSRVANDADAYLQSLKKEQHPCSKAGLIDTNDSDGK